ncbi:hypothetical protein KTR9_5189 (plasmid) [Gordonia sp. KTR9]|nr:hypothetical protein KTR9_5189 [Gordonia sp. KTR9]
MASKRGATWTLPEFSSGLADRFRCAGFTA